MKNLVIFGTLLMFTGCGPAEEPAHEPAEEATPVAVSLDVVEAESDVTEVEFENDLVRVIRTRRPAGHEGARHTHGKGVSVGLTNGSYRATFDNGEVNEGEGKVGEVGNTFDGMEPHVTANVGDSDMEGVMVELKVESGTPVDAPSHDAVEVDGEHHVVEFENELVRVIRMKYPEGYATPPHNHYAGVNVLLTDATATSAAEGEETEPAESSAGLAAWADSGEPHVTRNLGGEIEIVRVELKVQ